MRRSYDVRDTNEAIKSGVGKTIVSLKLKDNNLLLTFSDSSQIRIFDGGQSCCENRYMTTDDDLNAFDGAVFTSVEERPVINIPYGSGEHEVKFLLINTSLGTITLETHNIHNGYYSGFVICAVKIKE